MRTWLILTDPELFLIRLIVIVLSITLHEFGHAYSADRMGDDTPRRQGRVTLWPDKHFDPVGFLMIIVTMNVGRGIGWGKPVQVDVNRLRHPRRDWLISVACGPLMNLLLALVFGLILRVAISTQHTGWLFTPSEEYSVLGQFVQSFLYINLSLMFFNLIPIPPLDGSWLLGGLLPNHLATPYERNMRQYGPMILLGVCVLAPEILGIIIGPAVMSAARLIVGY